MRYLIKTAAIAAMLLIPGAATAAAFDPQPDPPASWFEQGDAGGTGNPQRTMGPSPHMRLGAIQGFIGGDDMFDVFTIRLAEPPDNAPNSFHAGVNFDIFDEANPALTLELFNERGASVAVSFLMLHEDGSIIPCLRVEDLAEGIYHLGVFADAGLDPAYTISFLTDNVEFFGTVPEPVTLSLLGAGLFGIAATRRVRRRR